METNTLKDINNVESGKLWVEPESSSMLLTKTVGLPDWTISAVS